jgi:hypothetical protein
MTGTGLRVGMAGRLLVLLLLTGCIPMATTSRPRSIALGAYISGAPWDSAKLDEFAILTKTRPSIVMWYQDWVHPGVREFDPTKMDAVAARGAMPMVTWEPGDHRADATQPDFALRTILAGRHDAYIRQWARDAARWGKPMYLRFAHEMNGDWYPWSPGVNGNTRAEYTRAWGHVVGLFTEERAVNIRWVWSPNVACRRCSSFADLYPGDAVVDWVGLDGYNWGTSQSWSHWEEFVPIFHASYHTLTTLTTKPMLFAEIGSSELGGDKAAWMRRALLVDIPTSFPRVQAVVWFHEAKETDWRVNSSPAALAAYAAAAASPTYQGRLP